MTGSFLVPIIVPIVAFIALATWLGMVFWAEAHPEWKARATAPGPEASAAMDASPAAEPEAGHGSELAPVPPARKAA
jgi:hypothetical protein